LNNTNPTKTRGELRCSGRINISCATSDTRRVTLVTKAMISHEIGKDREVVMTSGYDVMVNQIVVVTVELSKT
jgi:hypothetical protein